MWFRWYRSYRRLYGRLVLFPLVLAGTFPLLAVALAADVHAAIALAAKDVLRAGPLSPEVRYLWVHHTDPRTKKLACQVLFAHVNSLSREPDIVPPAVVLEDGSVWRFPNIREEDYAKVALIRLVCRDYRWDRTEFFHLIEQDAFLHHPALLDGEKGYPLAPWLAETEADRQNLATLVNATQSQVPMLRADNFFWQTAIQEDRIVGYYGLLGFKDQRSFEAAVGFDRRASQAFVVELLAAVDLSGVTIQPRRIERDEKIAGAFWQSFDNRKALGNRNPLRTLNDEFRHDASEFYAHLANGLWANFLANAQGVAQNSAPDIVGRDSRTHNNDGRIHVYLGCVRCHKNAGLHDIRDAVRRRAKFPTFPQSPDYRAAVELRQKYLRRLDPFMARDRERYTTALAECNGLTPEQHSGNLEDYYAYVDSPVGIDRAADDLGTTPVKLLTALREQADREKNRPGADVVLGAFLSVPPDPIPYDQWLEAVPLAHLALRGLSQWPQTKEQEK
jgi:hypothetical protein